MSDKPRIAVTLGDAAGVGPEIVVRAFASDEVRAACRPLAIGDEGVLRRAIAATGVALEPKPVRAPDDAGLPEGQMAFFPVPQPGLDRLPMGAIHGACGAAAFAWVRTATELALARSVDAVATAPLNKESLRAGAVPHLDHTAMLAALTGTPEPLTLFTVGRLRVFFLTRHVTLSRACEMVTKARVLEGIVRCAGALRDLGITTGALAVAALNPHGGEHGLFGDEETREIEPAVAEARAKGIDAVGPVPADAVFHLAHQGRFAAVLSLYHDQGHIACKTLDFERTVSITCGLPFLRTSPDHGTAFDIAGKGLASATSMIESMLAAGRLAPHYRPNRRL
jgi:4-phospho-D-threonate 3-dehydrogenase / 4-phospho-D-erythronate 3-dehydrogenase